MRHNYKKELGLTLKEAKNRAKKLLGGRLPKCGYEVCVQNGLTDDNRKFCIYLQNEAGSFRLYKWVSVNYGI